VLYRVDTDNRLYGYNANDAAIGVEYCYGAHIDADEAYRKYLWTIAFICHQFGLDPAVSVVGHAFLDPTRKTDPAEYQACLGTADDSSTSQTHQDGNVQVTVKLNLRKGRPSRLADIAQVVVPGTKLPYAGWTLDGEPVNGNAKWFFDSNGNYFWSGATVTVT
jgi:N-acetylmuramoyl-L-alanine amidase